MRYLTNVPIIFINTIQQLLFSKRNSRFFFIYIYIYYNIINFTLPKQILRLFDERNRTKMFMLGANLVTE